MKCNLSKSQFDNVNISGMNLNGAILFNCKWRNMKIHELNKLDGHKDVVNSVCFSPDGTTLASGSNDYSISLWDIQTGKEIQSSDKSYKNILAQFKSSLFENNPPPENIFTYITILLILQTPIFQAQGALIHKDNL